MDDKERRQAFINGLRELADWYEAHPMVEVPYSHAINVMPDRADLGAVARSCGGFTKFYMADWIGFRREFGGAGGITLDLNFARNEVCTRRVVGQRKIEAHTIPARTEDVVEWDCHPLLAEAEGSAAP